MKKKLKKKLKKRKRFLVVKTSFSFVKFNESVDDRAPREDENCLIPGYIFMPGDAHKSEGYIPFSSDKKKAKKKGQ